MRRSYQTFGEVRQPFTDGSKKSTYSATAPPDQGQNLVIVDAEGRQIPVIRHGLNGGNYVIRAEKIVERTTVPASRFLVAEYRYNSDHQSQKEELFRDSRVEKRYVHPSDSTYHRPENVEYIHLDSAFDIDRPEELEEFLNKVVIEASSGPTRPVPAVPLTSARHSGPERIAQENTRKYGDERNFRRDDRKTLNGSPKRDRHYEPYLNPNAANTHPTIGNNRDVHESPNARNYQLSKPTNDIGTAVESLKGAVNPPYANAPVQTEANRRPIKTVPLPTTRLLIGSNKSGPEIKKEAKDYDSEEEEQESRNHLAKRDELKLVSNRGGAKPLEKKDGYEKPKGNAVAAPLGQTRFRGTTVQKKEQNTYPGKIDSREAARRYGKSQSRAGEEGKYEGTINCKEAAEKYNGVLVP